MTEEEQKLNWYAVLESGSMTAVHNLREYIKSLEKENADLKKQLEVTNKENERIRRTMLTYSECITEHQNTIKRKDEENERLKARIEKMKCCGNCKKRTLDNAENDICEVDGERVFCSDKCANWEMKE